MTNTGAETAERSTRTGDQTYFELLSSFDQLAPFRDEWDTFVERVGSDIYFTVDWLETWWKYYGSNRHLRCFLVRSGSRLVAVLPFCLQTLWAGPVPVKVARLVGSDSTIPVLSPPIEPGREQEVLALVLDQFFNKERCDAVSLSPLSGASPLTEATRALCATERAFQLICDDSIGPHTVFSLPQSFDQYMASLQPQQRTMHVRRSTQLSKRFQIKHDVIAGPNAPAYFGEFVRLHEAQWIAANHLGHFGDWPESLEFNSELIRKFAERNQVRFHVITGNGETLSIYYGFVFGDTCYWRLPARSINPDLERFALGRVGLVKMIEALIAEGVRTIEGGPGHYEYKLRHGAVELPLRRMVLTRSSSPSAWKARAAVAWSNLLHLSYYRIWFNRLVPRMPHLRRPLWRRWILRI